MKTINHQSGMSLLEVLVATIVFAVGMGGVASMMLSNMRNNNATLSRTHSNMLANEIYEKMLANLPGVEAGGYNLSMNASLPVSTQLDCASTIANCSPAQIATWDLALWGARTQRILQVADAAIVVDNLVDPMVIEVSVSFDALREIDGLTTETYTFRAR